MFLGSKAYSWKSPTQAIPTLQPLVPALDIKFCTAAPGGTTQTHAQAEKNCLGSGRKRIADTTEVKSNNIRIPINQSVYWNVIGVLGKG